MLMCNTTVHSGPEPMPVDTAIFKEFIVVRLGNIANGIELYLDERDAAAIMQQLQGCLAQIKKAAPNRGAEEENTTFLSLPDEEAESNVA